MLLEYADSKERWFNRAFGWAQKRAAHNSGRGADHGWRVSTK